MQRSDLHFNKSTLAALLRTYFRSERMEAGRWVEGNCNNPGDRQYDLDQNGGKEGGDKNSDSGCIYWRAE